MLQTYWHKLTDPITQNEEEKLREHMTRVILVLAFGALILFTVLVTLGWIQQSYDFLPVILMLVMDLAIGLGLWLATRGHWHWGSYITPVAFFLLAAYGSHSAGLVTTTVLLYVLAILLTSMLRGGREQWVMVILSTIAHVALGWQQETIAMEERVMVAITVSGSFFGVALLQWFFASQFKRALSSAKAYAAVLKEYRDHLEDLVKKRTAALGEANQELQREINERRQAQLDLKQAHDELELRVEERTAELSIMLDAAKAVSSTLNLDSILTAIAKQMVMAIDVTSCQIYRFDPDADLLLPWASWSRSSQNGGDPGPRDPLDLQATARLSLKTRTPQTLTLNKAQAAADDLAYLKSTESKSLLFLPLAPSGQVTGLVELSEGHRERLFSEDEVRLCQALADQAAVTIENANLHAETKRRSQRLAALHNIDMAITSSLDLKFTLNVVLEQVLSQLHVDAAAILMNEHRSLRFFSGRGFRALDLEHIRVRLGEGLAGRAALDRRRVLIPDLKQNEDHSPRLALFLDEDFTFYVGYPLIAKGELMGVLELFARRPLDPDPEWLDFLETLAGQAAIAIHNSERLDNLELTRTELEVAYGSTLEAWAASAACREGISAEEQAQLIEKTLRLARTLDVRGEQLRDISLGAMLHDIGLLQVPEEVLRKPAPLTDDERALIEEHPVHAYNLLAPIGYLEAALEIPYCHHERWDGSGYPRGLQEEEIPLAARIFAVVDVWQALTSDRPYRPAWSEDDARRYLEEYAGTLFEPRIVEAFFEMLVPA